MYPEHHYSSMSPPCPSSSTNAKTTRAQSSTSTSMSTKAEHRQKPSFRWVRPGCLHSISTRSCRSWDDAKAASSTEEERPRCGATRPHTTRQTSYRRWRSHRLTEIYVVLKSASWRVSSVLCRLSGRSRRRRTVRVESNSASTQTRSHLLWVVLCGPGRMVYDRLRRLRVEGEIIGVRDAPVYGPQSAGALCFP